MELALSIVVFVLSHVVIARGPVKPVMVERFGTTVYLVLYSLLSIAVLAWVVSALFRSPTVYLWDAPDWSYPFAVFVTGAAFTFLGAGLNSPNPVSVSFRRVGFDPERPGITGFMRHPVLAGFGLWGVAHIPANGDVAALGLFGGTVLFAALGATGLDKRNRREMGDDVWRSAVAGNGHVDRHAVTGALLGVVVWGVLLGMHPVLFGVDPLASALSAF